MFRYYSVSLEQSCILSCASRNAHLTLASHQRISDWQKINPGKKKWTVSAGSLSWTASARVHQAAESAVGAGAWSCWQEEQTHHPDKHLLHLISCIVKPHPMFTKPCLTGQVKYGLNQDTQEKTKGIFFSLHYLELNNSVRKSPSRDNVIDIHQILTFNSGSWRKSRVK